MHDDDQVDDISEGTAEPGPSRWRLIAGFFALTTVTALGVGAWFVLQTPGAAPGTVAGATLPLVQAPETVDRVRPAPDERGGAVIANTDKQVFDTFSKIRRPLEPGVERLLPPPETPLPESSATGAAGDANRAPSASVPETGYSPDNRGRLTDIVINKREAVPVPQPSGEAVVKPAIVQKFSVPQPRRTKDDKLAKLTEPTKSGKKPSGRIKIDLSEDRGDWRVQLAALRSHKDALATWKRLAGRHPDLFADRAPVVTGTDLLKKGTYHRLRTGGFESRNEAAKFCQKVKARKLECIVIRP